MVRFFSLSLLAALAATTLAAPGAEQQVLGDAPAQFFDGWGYQDCGSNYDAIQLKSIEVTPNPPKPGQDLTVAVKGTAIETIEEGAYADVGVKIGLIKLLSKRFDLCEEARNANTSIQCPVQEGEYTVSHTVKLPREIPRAKFTVDVKGYTVSDEDMICLKLTVDFMKLPFPISW